MTTTAASEKKYTGKHLLNGVKLLKRGHREGLTATQLAESEGVPVKTVNAIIAGVKKKFATTGADVPDDLVLVRGKRGPSASEIGIDDILAEIQKQDGESDDDGDGESDE